LTPIGVDERKARVAKAQRLLRGHDMGALLVEAGSALVYFTGVRWWRSERFTGAIIPRDGDIAFVTPFFEEPSVRESMTFGDDVRTWHEHENPFALVAGILADRKLTGGRIGVEGTVRHFIADGVQQAAPRFDVVSGERIVRDCRLYKSDAEIALMQAANDVTMAAYRHVHTRIEPGMAPDAIASMMNDATRDLGGTPLFALVLLNDASAYPPRQRTAAGRARSGRRADGLRLRRPRLPVVHLAHVGRRRTDPQTAGRVGHRQAWTGTGTRNRDDRHTGGQSGRCRPRVL
jgi:Xaa-Pro dipeptidase